MQIPSSFLMSNNQRKFLIASILLLGLTLSAFSMSRWAAIRRGHAQEPVLTAARAAGNDPERVRALHFTLTPLGFNPSAMTVPEGLYVIEVTNRSDLSTFSLNLGRIANHKLKEVDAIHRHGEWSGFFRLKSDDFVLTVNEKPEWKAKLQVTK